MCTILKDKIEGEAIGWKVVLVDSDGKVRSFYKNGYTWKSYFKNRPSVQLNFFTACTGRASEFFHCFTTRKQARLFKNGYHGGYLNNGWKIKIIKVILTGTIYKGITDGMSIHNGQPAICGSLAYWDGKFHS